MRVVSLELSFHTKMHPSTLAVSSRSQSGVKATAVMRALWRAGLMASVAPEMTSSSRTRPSCPHSAAKRPEGSRRSRSASVSPHE
jgi:hypothetical protein